ncbi:MAG TPA: peroxiredoxin [Deltaproteobacteria bacterium]|jgi:peroxiredoxin|nr:peroxiredoxin [Deltaproteobacteria bacterium]
MAKPPKVGDPAPDFTLPSTQGSVRLSDRLAKQPVLLVFYPGDDTPVCTKQLCNYRDHLDVFSGLGVEVLAINPQSESSHTAFAKKHALPFPLLSDAGGVVCGEYGALSLFGMAKRALVLVGQDGRVKWRRTDFPLFHQTADDVRRAVAQLRL